MSELCANEVVIPVIVFVNLFGEIHQCVTLTERAVPHKHSQRVVVQNHMCRSSVATQNDQVTKELGSILQSY